MGGSAIRRPLKREEKAIVTFELYGELNEADRNAFNATLRQLLGGKGVVITSDVDTKNPGDP